MPGIMIGQTVAHYRIESRVGSGGMGIVYRAFDQQLQRPVALKFLPPHLSQDDDAKQRFMQEARAASALDHANLCTVHHIGETDDGQIYIVMPFYDGTTLKYRLRAGGMPESTALDYARQIAAGLGRAHEAGIVHRDIKPANIMVTDRGEVKILDFGVAKLESSADLTRAGSTVGTAAYMSPEQTRGDRVGPASDVWSLGVLLYEMLSGRRPFDADYDQALAYSIANEEPAPIPGLGQDTEKVLRRLLAKNPAERLADGRAALSALGGHASGAHPAAPTSDAAEVRAQPVGRIVTLFGAGTVATLALVYAAMMQFGLPDWVLWLGAALLAAGLPILVYAARVEMRRAGMDSGERRMLSGLPSWITVRRAWVGGGVAMIGLALVATTWMTMRALGIGPAGTLMTRGVLTETDRVIVADFDDQTADGVLGRTIAEALRIDLAQSPVVSLAGASEIRAVLERMQREASARMDLPLAREVALRIGAKAIVAGEVAPLGSSYTINLRLLDAESGEELVPLRETAESDATIVQAVDRLSGSLRERIGESLRTIRAGAPLEQVSTASLDALRHYSAGVVAFDARDFGEAEDELRRAIAIDSNFAMAYRKLSVLYSNTGTNKADMYLLSEKAFELKDRLPEEERFLAEAWYHSTVMKDEASAMRTYRSMLERFPDHDIALNNSAVGASRLGRDEEAIRFARRAIRVTPEPYISHFENLAWSLGRMERFEEEVAVMDSMTALFPEAPGPPYYRAILDAMRTGGFAAATDSLRAQSARVTDPGVRTIIRDAWTRFEAIRGRIRSAAAIVRSAVDVETTMGPDQALAEEASVLVSRLAATGDRESVSGALRDLLERYPLDAMHPLDRPYPLLAYLSAMLGRPDEARRLLDEQAALWPEPLVLKSEARLKALGTVAMAENDPIRAIRHFREASRVQDPDTFCDPCATYELGLALRAADSLETAARLLGSSLAMRSPAQAFDGLGTRALAWRLLGDVSESLGRPDDAISAYEHFLDLWAEADPELQPQVRDVRERVDRLLAERARETAG